MERLTPSHLKLLRLIDDGAPHFGVGAWDGPLDPKTLEDAIRGHDAALAGDLAFAKDLLRDLASLDFVRKHGGVTSAWTSRSADSW